MATRRQVFSTICALSLVAVWSSLTPPSAVSNEARDSSSDVELLRSDLRTKKMELIADRMQFTGKEADVFWPLYRKYEVELAAINDKKIAVMQEYLKSFDTLDNARAKDLAQKVLDVDQMALDLRKKSFQEMSAVLPAKTVVRFLQLERRLQQLVDVQLASELPIIKK